jgi:hypothetical protein
MSDANTAVMQSPPVVVTPPAPEASDKEVVSTHVLVEPEKVEQLRELSRRSRIAQSEYLREAVDDLLVKYEKITKDGQR